MATESRPSRMETCGTKVFCFISVISSHSQLNVNFRSVKNCASCQFSNRIFLFPILEKRVLIILLTILRLLLNSFCGVLIFSKQVYTNMLLAVISKLSVIAKTWSFWCGFFEKTLQKMFFDIFWKLIQFQWLHFYFSKKNYIIVLYVLFFLIQTAVILLTQMWFFR